MGIKRSQDKSFEVSNATWLQSALRIHDDIEIKTINELGESLDSVEYTLFAENTL